MRPKVNAPGVMVKMGWGRTNSRRKRVRGKRILGSKIVYRDDSMMATLVAAGPQALEIAGST